jgi:energy-coupling factor transporter ATP-binding protein EcfA2
MSSEPIDEIEAWSKKLLPWRRDCLRRLAISNELTEEDLCELLAMIKQGAGFVVDEPAPAPVAFTKAHFGGVKQQPIVLKGIANVKNVNRLVPEAQLVFCPAGLTVVYGRNGSGKSGFVRILRTACRTRIEKAEKLRVLGDVYGASTGPQSADIIIDNGGGDISIKWQPGMVANPELMQVAVFDTASAQLYVDAGNQIRFLPFGLALPHRLNTVCLSLKEKLEKERAAVVGDKISLTEISFPTIRSTKAQAFSTTLTKATRKEEIDEAAVFEAGDQTRLDEIVRILATGSAAVADVSALATWTDSLAKECESAVTSFDDKALLALTTLSNTAIAAREAAQLAAGELFTDEPLEGVGSESWRALWEAARDYSVKEAYVGLDYPVVAMDDGKAACVMCQQPLQPDAAARMQRFQKYMDDTLDVGATKAEKVVTEAAAGLPELKLLRADDFADRIEQVRMRDPALADSLSNFQAEIVARREDAVARVAGTSSKPLAVLVSPVEEVKALAKKLQEEKEALAEAGNTDERAKLAGEQVELEDRKILAANKNKLKLRKTLQELDAAYAAALAEVQTKGITQRANELLDAHLTTAVANRFDAEREHFDIMHLNVGLARKSGQTKAEFQVDPQTKLTKVTSDILSEGEQRALALAGFLTEVALTDGSGPIIVDDPMSSLDRERCSRVAHRLADEAAKRQVIVFTHDIMFFNELCEAAHQIGIEPVTVALFSDKKVAGRIDKTGIGWKGAPVKKRIGRIKDAFAPLSKIHDTSPAQYEMEIKNLYGRLRDTYERVVEEIIFCDIVRRGVDVVQTQKLRMVHLSHPLAIRFYEGMTKANTHSHDNPAADTVPVPPPDEFQDDVAFLESLIADLKVESQTAEAARPQMKPKS